MRARRRQGELCLLDLWVHVGKAARCLQALSLKPPHTLACLRLIGQTASRWEDVSAADSCRSRPLARATIFLGRWVPKAKCLVIGAKPRERLQGDSWSQQCWGGQVLGMPRQAGWEANFIWCYSKSEAAERAAATFLQQDGEGVTLIKYLGPFPCRGSAGFCLGTCLSH